MLYLLFLYLVRYHFRKSMTLINAIINFQNIVDLLVHVYLNHIHVQLFPMKCDQLKYLLITISILFKCELRTRSLCAHQYTREIYNNIHHKTIVDLT